MSKLYSNIMSKYKHRIFCPKYFLSEIFDLKSSIKKLNLILMTKNFVWYRARMKYKIL